MKHLIYAVAAVSAFGLSAGAFACGAHTASADNGTVVVAQQQQMDNGMAAPNSGDQDNSAASDEDKSKE